MPSYYVHVTRELVTVTHQSADIEIEAEDLADAEKQAEAMVEKGDEIDWETNETEEGVEEKCVGEIEEVDERARGFKDLIDLL